MNTFKPTATERTPLEKARSFTATWSHDAVQDLPSADLLQRINTLQGLHAALPILAGKLPGAALLLRLRAEQLRRVTREAACTAPDSRWRQRPADGPYAAVLRSVGGEWAVRAYLQQQ